MTVHTCGRCGALCERDDRRCARCGRFLPALLGHRALLDRVFPRESMWSRYMAMTLAIIYLAMTLVAQRQGFVGEGMLGKLTAGSFTLLQFGAVFRHGMLTPVEYHDFVEPFTLHGQWWRLVTANFLHIGIIHLLFNVVALLQAGPLIERFYGPARFLLVFVVSGVVGFAASLALVDAPTAGASASLCGLIGAMIAYGIRRGGTHGQEVRNFAIQWGVYILIFGLLVSNVNNVAHIGGAIGGFGTAWFFDVYHSEKRGRESDGARLGALAACAFVLACIAFGVRFGLEFQGVIDSGLR